MRDVGDSQGLRLINRGLIDTLLLENVYLACHYFAKCFGNLLAAWIRMYFSIKNDVVKHFSKICFNGRLYFADTVTNMVEKTSIFVS